mgnify:FL=1
MDQEFKNQTNNEEIDLLDYFRLFRQNKWLIIIFFFLGLAFAGVATFSLPQHKTEAYLEIKNFPPEKTIEGLKNKITIGFYGDYRGIKLTNPQNTNLIRFESANKEPLVAEKRIKDLVTAILGEQSAEINAQKGLAREQIERLKNDVDLLLNRGLSVEMLKLEISRAEKQLDDFQPAESIIEPRTVNNLTKSLWAFNLIIGGMLGIFIGFLLAVGKKWWGENKSKI